MLDSSMAGEIMQRAQMLLKIKGEDALEYSKNVLEDMQKTGEEKDRAYWHRIVRQVELLVEENGSG